MVRPKPKIDDVYPGTDEPKYVNFAAYEADLRLWAQEEKEASSSASGAVTAGIGFGSAMAMILSFEHNHSILWMIVHGICSWAYVIYRACQGNY